MKRYLNISQTGSLFFNKTIINNFHFKGKSVAIDKNGRLYQVQSFPLFNQMMNEQVLLINTKKLAPSKLKIL